MLYEVITRFMELLAFDGIHHEEHLLAMHALPSGRSCVLSGSEAGPDFTTVHMEVLWPQGAEQGTPDDPKNSAVAL